MFQHLWLIDSVADFSAKSKKFLHIRKKIYFCTTYLLSATLAQLVERRIRNA